MAEGSILRLDQDDKQQSELFLKLLVSIKHLFVLCLLFPACLRRRYDDHPSLFKFSTNVFTPQPSYLGLRNRNRPCQTILMHAIQTVRHLLPTSAAAHLFLFADEMGWLRKGKSIPVANSKADSYIPQNKGRPQTRPPGTSWMSVPLCRYKQAG